MISWQFTATLLVAGTCIGAGMVSLPLKLAKIGVIPSIVMIILTWLFTYYCSLIYVELVLHSKHYDTTKSFPLEFSGKKAKWIEDWVIILLSYAGLAAYINGCASILRELICYDNLFLLQTFLTIFIVVLFFFPTNWIKEFNSVAFIIFMALLLFILLKMITCIHFSNIPFIISGHTSEIPGMISLVFVSFGCQVVFYVIKEYCNNDVVMIQKAFFYGTLIPAILYILWSCTVLSIIYGHNSSFFNNMVTGDIAVGDLITELSQCFNFKGLQILVYWIMIFTILTSIIGVGLGLYMKMQKKLEKKISYARIIAIFITILPPYVISVSVPNAFTVTLQFAGALLIIISVLMPTYLYFKAGIEKPRISILSKPALLFCAIVGILIMFL